MAVTNGYCTLADLRLHISDTSDKFPAELMERAINATSRAIDDFCGRRFWQDDSATARTYRAEDPVELVVDDISTTTGLVIATDTTGDGTYDTTWDSGDYELEPADADADGGAYAWWRIVAVGSRLWPVATAGVGDTRGVRLVRSRRRRVQITAQWGWSAIPDPVEQACLLRAAALFKRREATWGVAGFNEMGLIRIRQDSDVAELLAPYRRISVGGV